MTDWAEIVIPVPRDAAEDVAALIAARVPEAASGCELRDDAIAFWVDAGAAERTLARTREAATELAAAGMTLDAAAVHAQAAAPESEWRDAWKRHFRTTRITRRIVIVPSWDTFAPAAGDVAIDLDPGQAFGTGAHASTALCLEALDDLAQARPAIARFLDVGTGSGILAIAAAKLWPAAAGIAVDDDPTAVATAADNLAGNGLAARVACSDAPLATVTGTFDVVVANIQADVLEALRDELAARVAPGGALVLSGLLTSQIDAVSRSYAGAGLTVVATPRSERDREWSAIRLQRA
jgi:ribosomal protein L11 methyltransferase